MKKILFVTLFTFICLMFSCWSEETGMTGGASSSSGLCSNSSEPCIIQNHSIMSKDTAGECVFQACEFLWADCDGDLTNGCETILTTDNNCGSCENLCQCPKQCSVVCDVNNGTTCLTSCK